MGQFISMTGAVGSNCDSVRDGITDFLRSGKSKGRTSKKDRGTIVESVGGVTVLYPESFMCWDECTEHLSSYLAAPAFSFHIHDGDLWMYILFSNGEKADQFNPVPDYWEELSPEDKAQWKGNAQTVADLVPGLSADSIEKYLVQWDWNDPAPQRAYQDDESPAGDCWQLVDFMKKLGLKYPVDDQGNIEGEILNMRGLS